MEEFKFPPPKGDRLNEVVFGTLLPKRNGDVKGLGQGLGPIIPLLPEANLEPVDMLNQVTSSSVRITPWQQSATLKGKIYSKLAPPSNNLGLVIMVHGALTKPLNNAYLSVMETYGQQLASQGFVAISIFHAQDGAEAASSKIIDNINFFMQKKGADFNLFGKPLALLGHSEGGKGAILAATKIRTGATSSYFKEVSAVIALAPAFSDGEPHVEGKFAQSLLILSGTHDYDQNAKGGRPLHFYPEKDPTPSQHFFWCHGFNHTSFLDAQGEEDKGVGIIDDGGRKKDDASRTNGPTQRLVTKNYVAMFILWRLAGRTVYKKIFVGTGIVSWKNLDTDQKQGIQSLRCLPRFDLSGTFIFGAKPSFLGFYTNANLNQIIDAQHPAPFGSIEQLNLSCMYQEAFRYIVAWDRTKSPSPKILVDCDPDTLALGLAAIDFDAVQLNNSSLNNSTPTTTPVPISVALRHKNLPFLRSDPVTVLIEPSLFIAAKASDQGNPPLYRTVLSTIRVPFAKFKLTPEKLKDYTKLELSFINSAPEGRIVIGGFRGSMS